MDLLTFNVNLEELPKIDAIQLALMYSATKWWRGKRPLSFSVLEHIQNPTINLSHDAEDRLATYTSMFVAKHGFFVYYKRTNKVKLWRKYVPVWSRWFR